MRLNSSGATDRPPALSVRTRALDRQASGRHFMQKSSWIRGATFGKAAGCHHLPTGSPSPTPNLIAFDARSLSAFGAKRGGRGEIFNTETRRPEIVNGELSRVK